MFNTELHIVRGNTTNKSGERDLDIKYRKLRRGRIKAIKELKIRDAAARSSVLKTIAVENIRGLPSGRKSSNIARFAAILSDPSNYSEKDVQNALKRGVSFFEKHGEEKFRKECEKSSVNPEMALAVIRLIKKEEEQKTSEKRDRKEVLTELLNVHLGGELPDEYVYSIASLWASSPNIDPESIENALNTVLENCGKKKVVKLLADEPATVVGEPESLSDFISKERESVFSAKLLSRRESQFRELIAGFVDGDVPEDQIRKLAETWAGNPEASVEAVNKSLDRVLDECGPDNFISALKIGSWVFVCDESRLSAFVDSNKTGEPVETKDAEEFKKKINEYMDFLGVDGAALPKDEDSKRAFEFLEEHSLTTRSIKVLILLFKKHPRLFVDGKMSYWKNRYAQCEKEVPRIGRPTKKAKKKRKGTNLERLIERKNAFMDLFKKYFGENIPAAYLKEKAKRWAVWSASPTAVEKAMKKVLEECGEEELLKTFKEASTVLTQGPKKLSEHIERLKSGENVENKDEPEPAHQPEPEESEPELEPGMEKEDRNSVGELTSYINLANPEGEIKVEIPQDEKIAERILSFFDEYVNSDADIEALRRVLESNKRALFLEPAEFGVSFFKKTVDIGNESVNVGKMLQKLHGLKCTEGELIDRLREIGFDFKRAKSGKRILLGKTSITRPTGASLIVPPLKHRKKLGAKIIIKELRVFLEKRQSNGK